MYGDQHWLAEQRPVAAFLAGGPSNRAIRRHARRHGQLTLADQVAFWRAHRLGQQWSRGPDAIGWPAHVRVLVLLFLVAGLTMGAFFA